MKSQIESQWIELENDDVTKLLNSLTLGSDVVVGRNGKTSRGIVYGLSLNKITLCLDSGEMYELSINSEQGYYWRRRGDSAYFECYFQIDRQPEILAEINFYKMRSWKLEALSYLK